MSSEFNLGNNFAIDFSVSNLHCDVAANGLRYIVFTFFDENTILWSLCATDGITVWKATMDKSDISSITLESADSFADLFGKIRTAFSAAALNIAPVGSSLSLTLDSTSPPLVFTLAEATATDAKLLLKRVIFLLADANNSLQQDVSKLTRELEKAKRGGMSTNSVSQFDVASPDTYKKGRKVVRRKEGMSIINPSSKKLKAHEKGVKFD